MTADLEHAAKPQKDIGRLKSWAMKRDIRLYSLSKKYDYRDVEVDKKKTWDICTLEESVLENVKGIQYLVANNYESFIDEHVHHQ